MDTKRFEEHAGTPQLVLLALISVLVSFALLDLTPRVWPEHALLGPISFVFLSATCFGLGLYFMARLLKRALLYTVQLLWIW